MIEFDGSHHSDEINFGNRYLEILDALYCAKFYCFETMKRCGYEYIWSRKFHVQFGNIRCENQTASAGSNGASWRYLRLKYRLQLQVLRIQEFYYGVQYIILSLLEAILHAEGKYLRYELNTCGRLIPAMHLKTKRVVCESPASEAICCRPGEYLMRNVFSAR